MFRLLHGDGERRQGVCDQVHHQDLTGVQGRGEPQDGRPDDQPEFADVATQQEAEGTAHVSPKLRPSTNVSTSVEKSSSVSTTAAAWRQPRSPRGPWRPRRRPGQGRGVIDPVPGHGHDVAPASQSLDDPELVQRRGSGDHRRPFEPPVQLVFGQLGEFAPREDLPVLIEDAGFPRMARAVAGWSPVIMTSRTPASRPPHGRRHRGPERVADADEAEGHQVPGVLQRHVGGAFRNHEDAEAPIGQAASPIQGRLPARFIQGRVTVAAA